MADAGVHGLVVISASHGMEQSVARVGATEQHAVDVERGAIGPAEQSTGEVSAAGHGACEHAICKVQRGFLSVAHKASHVLVVTAVDGHVGKDETAVDGICATPGEAHQSGSMGGAVHGAFHSEVLDGGAGNIAEGCCALVGGVVKVGGKLMLCAVEDTGKRCCFGSHSGCYVYVVVQAEELATVVGAGSHFLCQQVPLP